MPNYSPSHQLKFVFLPKSLSFDTKICMPIFFFLALINHDHVNRILMTLDTYPIKQKTET